MLKRNTGVLSVILVAVLVVSVIRLSYSYLGESITNDQQMETVNLIGGTISTTYNDNTPNIFLENPNIDGGPVAFKQFSLRGNSTSEEKMHYKLRLVIDENTFGDNVLFYTLSGVNYQKKSGNVVERIEKTPIFGKNTIDLCGNVDTYFEDADNADQIYTINIYLNDNVTKEMIKNKVFKAHVKIDYL